MKCRICGKEYEDSCDNYNILDSLGSLYVSYEYVCSDCLYEGFHKLTKYASELFKENI